MFERIKRRLRERRVRIDARDEELRIKRITRELAAWRNQLAGGRCNKCGAGMVIARKAGTGGDDIFCCENQYLNDAPFTLNGTGRCVNVADMSILNKEAESIGEPVMEVSDRVRVIEMDN